MNTEFKNTCQACEAARAVVTEPDEDPQSPYFLCQACHTRLLEYRLRPLEWYNLAKRFGSERFYLHDDFYTDEGEAMQPETEVENQNEFPAPKLTLIQNDPELLFEYSYTRWKLNREILTAWAELPTTVVFAKLTEKIDPQFSIDIRSLAIALTGYTLNKQGAKLILNTWKNQQKNPVYLGSLIAASVSCLDRSDAIARSIAAVDALPSGKQYRALPLLRYLASDKTLDWLELNICEPLTNNWGHLAAASDFSWERAIKWLSMGRPWSLIAIDALVAIADPPGHMAKESPYRLKNPPTKVHLFQTLESYAKLDPVPRVEQRIQSLLAKSDRLTVA